MRTSFLSTNADRRALLRSAAPVQSSTKRRHAQWPCLGIRYHQIAPLLGGARGGRRCVSSRMQVSTPARVCSAACVINAMCNTDIYREESELKRDALGASVGCIVNHKTLVGGELACDRPATPHPSRRSSIGEISRSRTSRRQHGQQVTVSRSMNCRASCRR